jgi:hypothetical protein
MGLLAALPVQNLSEALYEGSTSIGLWLKVKTALKSVGHWDTIYDLYKTKNVAEELLTHYEQYPSTPDGFGTWRGERDDLMERVYDITGAEPKY